MHILGIVDLAIQVFFAVHAAKNGRYGWIFIILIFPLVGSLVYFFVEYLPDIQMKAGHTRAKNISPQKKIKQLERELQLTDSVQNRTNLAEAFFKAGRYHEAIELLEKCLSGPYASDPHILEGLCYSHFYNGDNIATKEYLERLERVLGNGLPEKMRILKARNLEKLGEIDNALAEYESCVKICTGEEARCRYGLLLKRVGQGEKARALFNEILNNAQLYPKQYQRFQKEWVDIAKAHT